VTFADAGQWSRYRRRKAADHEPLRPTTIVDLHFPVEVVGHLARPRRDRARPDAGAAPYVNSLDLTESAGPHVLDHALVVPYRRYCRPVWRGWMRSVLDRAGNSCNTLAKRRAAELELEGHEPMPIVFRREPRFEQILLGVR